ncbi:MAG: ABC transporter permease [Saprospiraceae bacterium]|nr:ABC transporter permease [Saprospiraceae bacterium]
MALALRIALRYFASKRSTNAIHIITGIAVFGVAMGAAALLLVLSVFNGFEDLITGMYNSFNPDLKVVPLQGKTFVADEATLSRLKAVPGVKYVSCTLEEVAFFEYKSNQDFGAVKGVDSNFIRVSNVDSMVREGAFLLEQEDRYYAVLGLGMRNKLNVNVDDQYAPLTVYMPKRQETAMLEQQFRRRFIYPAGTFVIQQEFDNKYVITSLEAARELLGYDEEVSALELRLSPDASPTTVQKAIQELMGAQFVVKNRYEQEETFMRLMQVEKWLSFAIVSLMMLMVSFNLIGALWMIVLEKQPDIAILKSMGATDNLVRNIFLLEGALLCLIGIGTGFILAIAIYAAQKIFGIVSIPGNLVIDSYPISMRIGDMPVVAATVLFIGLLASLPPAMRAVRVQALIREE